MDELRLIQIWVIATLGGVVGAGFLYVRRVEAGPAARLWAWAWLSFFVSLIISVWPDLIFEVLAHATGTAFPEKRVTARSKLCQKKWTGLHFPRNRPRNSLKIPSTWTKTCQKRVTASGS